MMSSDDYCRFMNQHPDLCLWFLETPVPHPRPRFSRGRWPTNEVTKIITRGINNGTEPRHIAWQIKLLLEERSPQVHKDPRQTVYAAKLQELFFEAAARSQVASLLPVAGPVSVALRIGVKDLRESGDVDNYTKGVFDAMNSFVWQDDFQVNRLYAVRQNDWLGLQARFWFDETWEGKV